MIQKYLNTSIITLIIFCIGCDEDINYKYDFEEDVVLYCIINGDTNYQTAIVSSSFNDKNDTENHFIQNVQINLESNGTSVYLDESTGNGIEKPKNYYYTEKFTPKSGEIVLSAILPNGKELKSNINIPSFGLTYSSPRKILIPTNDQLDKISINWSLINAEEEYFYLPILSIYYSIQKNNTLVKKKFEIPIEYLDEESLNKPLFPPISRNSFLVFIQDDIDRAFSEISNGLEDKSEIKILGGIFEIYVMERNLASYKASIVTFTNTLSVKVYEPIVSNINGGLGLFGAYKKLTVPVEVSDYYIRSFGYQTN